jgi:hypothetical protein
MSRSKEQVRRADTDNRDSEQIQRAIVESTERIYREQILRADHLNQIQSSY